MQHLEGSGTPILYTGRTVLNPYPANVENRVTANSASRWQMGFKLAFKRLKVKHKLFCARHQVGGSGVITPLIFHSFTSRVLYALG